MKYITFTDKYKKEHKSFEIENEKDFYILVYCYPFKEIEKEETK